MAELIEAVVGSPAVVSVLKKRGLANEDGSLRIVNIQLLGQDNKPLGDGPVLDPAVIEKFAQLDTTRSAKILDWMLFEAAGGAVALEESNDAIKRCAAHWMKDRQEGRGEEEAPIKPMSPEEASAAWEKVEPMYRLTLVPADEDMLRYYMEKAGIRVYGYTRYWPGLGNIYETVYQQVREFIENVTARHGNQSKISIINQARNRRATDPKGPAEDRPYVPVDPDIAHYTLAQLQELNGEFKRYFKRAVEIKNIQFIGANPEGGYVRGTTTDTKLYEDDNLIVYIPATAAAMMQVGFDNWCVANRTEFDTAFRHRNPEEPRWTEYNRDKGPIAVIHLKPDVVEPDRPRGHQYYLSLKRIGVHLRRDKCNLNTVEPPYKGIQFFDRENRNSPPPVEWPELLQRLSRVENGSALIESVKAAMDKIMAWVRQVQPGDIKVDVLEWQAMVLVKQLLL